MKKAALHNLGCKVNAYETEAMQQMLEDHGYEIVPFSKKADVYVINTCSVTNIADRKSRQMLHRAKKMNPESIVVAAGCYVQTSAEQARADASVDILIGNNKKHELITLLEAFEEKKEKNFSQENKYPLEKAGRLKDENSSDAIIDLREETDYEEMTVNRTLEKDFNENQVFNKTRAFIKVQDGCNQFCSYCIIPYARGRVRSRGAKEVLEEAVRLSEHGYKEIVLTGIHLSSYGADTGESLLHLIQLIHEVDGIRRIRLGSLEPNIITEDFASALSRLNKVCPHFHLSLQSGCDETLRRMNRKYTCEEYKKGCSLLRKYYEHPAITTDVIVGFPGETEQEFEKTRKFLKEIAFFKVHIFKYSIRKGTKAAEMEDQVSEEIKTKRSNLLSQDTEQMCRDFVRWYHGKQVEGLMEYRTFQEEKGILGEKEYFVGYTREYVKIATGAEENLVNKIVKGSVKYSMKDPILLLDNFSTENMD